MPFPIGLAVTFLAEPARRSCRQPDCASSTSIAQVVRMFDLDCACSIDPYCDQSENLSHADSVTCDVTTGKAREDGLRVREVVISCAGD
jgi:hypothetical protein